MSFYATFLLHELCIERKIISRFRVLGVKSHHHFVRDCITSHLTCKVFHIFRNKIRRLCWSRYFVCQIFYLLLFYLAHQELFRIKSSKSLRMLIKSLRRYINDVTGTRTVFSGRKPSFWQKN